jgi:hypothetical protein
MTKKNFWEFVGELITTLNLDVPPHVIIGASVSVLDRTVDGLPIGLSHGLMQGSHAVYIFTFTALACLVAALTWGGLLLSLTPFLETKGVAASFLRYLITGLFMAAVPLFFNGPEQMLLGILAAILFKILAAYELSPYTRGQENDYLVSELGHLNSDGGSREIREGGHLVLLNLGGLFPLARWSRFVGPLVTNVVRRSVMAAAEFQLFYQGLWYNKKYRRTRKKVRHFLETPIRLRRYWYLTCR